MGHNGLFPQHGQEWTELERDMNAACEGDIPWQHGRSTKSAFIANDKVSEIGKAAYGRFLTENALYLAGFNSIRKFETEVVRMSAEILGGSEETCGVVTAGGSESIFLAVYAAREHARATRPEITHPEILLPRSGHATFNKAAHYLGLGVRRVSLGPDFRADLPAMAAAIGPDTVLVVGSAPQWPHGVIDPITELAAMCQDRGIWFHVDACVGGFMAPFVRLAGYPVPPFELSVPGVWSISADIHKYGFSPKGASVLLLRDQTLRGLLDYTFGDWPSGIYKTSTVLGSRTGGAMAAAWAVLRSVGEDGYTNFARRTMTTRDALIQGISAIDGLKVLGRPDITLMSYGSDLIDMAAVAEGMEARGWSVSQIREPKAIHMALSPVHEPIIGTYLSDLTAAVVEVRAGLRQTSGAEALYSG